MAEKKTSLFKDAVEMIEIFRSLSATEQEIAIAYAAGRAGRPLNTVIRLPEQMTKGPAA